MEIAVAFSTNGGSSWSNPNFLANDAELSAAGTSYDPAGINSGPIWVAWGYDARNQSTCSSTDVYAARERLPGAAADRSEPSGPGGDAGQVVWDAATPDPS